MKTTFYEDRKEKHIAKELQNQLETGSVNKAESARRHGMSRARITLIMNLLKLEPTIK